MATPSKTAGTTLISLQQVAAAATVKSSATDVSTKISATFYVNIGRDVTTALTAGVDIRIEGSPDSSGDDQWRPLVSGIKTGTVASESEAVTGTEAIGATVIEVASTTNLVAGDQIFFKNTTIGNSEFSRILSIVANTSVTIIDALTRAQTGSTIFDQAEFFVFANVNLKSVVRVRAIIDNSVGGVAVNAEVKMSSFDSWA